MLYRMAALKLLMSESCFRNVVLHIFLGNYKLFFGQSISQKHLGTTDMKERSFI